MHKTIFIDTQVYLHYQPFTQVNWLDVLRASEVTIIIPPVIVRELNKHKELHSRPQVKKRADQVLKQLLSLFESATQTQIRDNVEMRLESRDPMIDFAAFKLSHDIQDDNLIASIIMFQKENPGTEVELITSDAGLLLIAKASQLGISATRLPDKFKLPEEPDPEQTRIKELENELREMRLRIPQLSLVFEDDSQRITFTLPHPVGSTQEEIENEVRRIKQQHPKMKHVSQQISKLPEHIVSIIEAASNLNASLGNTILPEDIDDYNTRLDKFYQTYGEYLKRETYHQNLKLRSIKLDIFVANNGSAPAEDIDVFMHFPDGFKLTDAEGFPEFPKPPNPPQEPRSPRQKWYESIIGASLNMPALTSYMPDTVLPVSNVSAPSIKKSNSYDVSFHVQGVKHKLRESSEPLYVIFDSFESAQSFHVDYRILAANVPNEIRGRLHVVVKKEEI